MAANGKTSPLSLIRENAVLIKPSEPTPSQLLSLSTIDNGPNLEIICQTIYVYRPKNSSPINNHNVKDESSSSSDPAITLKQSLSRALVYYYPLAGKLKRRADDGTLQITCNADGVPFIEATANCTLESLNYFEKIDIETAHHFVFDFPTDSIHGYHPLVLQVTKFSCGGFTVGMGLSHSVCDGLGAARFFRATVELGSGRTEPTIKPVWERERLIGVTPNNNHQEEKFQLFELSSLTKSPFLPAKKLLHECFDVDAESIKRLKSRWSTDAERPVGPVGPFTIIEILGAYVWRSRFRALKQSPDKKTVLHVTLGIRNLVDPPLPEGYYGNAFVSANVVITGQELDEKPLSETAGLIKKSKRAASEGGYIREWLSFSEAFRRRKMTVDDGGASMVLTDWRQLKLMKEMDVGSRELVNMMPIAAEIMGFVNLCVFLPANRINAAMEGGVRVLVYLPGDAMTVFRQEMDALKLDAENES